MAAELKSTTQGQTMVLTISHPENQNSLGSGICSAAIEALSVAENQDDIRSVIITGEGACFSIGSRAPQPPRTAPEAHQQAVESLHNWIEAIRAFPKPVLAAVEGLATEDGFSLALSCDLIVSARNALYSWTEALAGGVGQPDAGGRWTLARALPRQQVSEWLLLGMPLHAEELARHGLINRLTAPGQALDTALDLATQLNQRPTQALLRAKEQLEQAPSLSLTAHLAQERRQFAQDLFRPAD